MSMKPETLYLHCICFFLSLIRNVNSNTSSPAFNLPSAQSVTVVQEAHSLVYEQFGPFIEIMVDVSVFMPRFIFSIDSHYKYKYT